MVPVCTCSGAWAIQSGLGRRGLFKLPVWAALAWGVNFVNHAPGRGLFKAPVGGLFKLPVWAAAVWPGNARFR